MKKTRLENSRQVCYFLNKIEKGLVILMVAVFLITISSFQIQANDTIGQEKISFKKESVSIKTVLKEIEKQSKLRFFYDTQQVDVNRKVSVDFRESSVKEAIEQLFKGTSIDFKFSGRQILLYESLLSSLSTGEEIPNANGSGYTPFTVSGLIIDDTGQPIPGVNVLEKGTTNGVTSDNNGQYKLNVVDANSTLVFSFIGYTSEEMAVNGQSTINVTLFPDVRSLQEVVVLSYGQQAKRDVTGSVSQIKSEELSDMTVPQFSQKLQGKIAGVQINQTTGIPGQGMTIRIRGAASINAGNGPLIVIDGFPITGSINDINPDEIETITVLKDASASSLYGSRAANGVVLITTKSASKGETKVQFNAYSGIQVVPQKGRPDLMNAEEFAQFQKEYREDETRYRGTPLNVPTEYQNPSQWAGKGTDWYDVLLRSAKIENYNLTVTADKEKLRTSVVAGYFNQEGVLINSDFKRISLRVNSEYKVNEKIKFGLNLAPNLTTSVSANTDGVLWSGGIIQNAMLTSPLAPYKNDDGSLPLTATSPGLFPNPNWYRVAQERKYTNRSIRTLTNAYVNFEIIPGLNFKSSINGEYGDSRTNYFIPSTSGFIFDPPPRKTEASVTTNTYYSWLIENTLSYSKTIATDHSLDALVGYTSQKFTNPYSYLYGTGFPNDEVKTLNAASITNGSSDYNEWTLLSFVGRLNYSYKGKYLLSAAMRRDGSSRFGPNNRWGFFPSISVGWIVSDEQFLQDNVPVISYLKMRGSYGLTGNNNIGNYAYYAAVTSANYVFNGGLSNGSSISSLGNNSLGWEKTSQTDIGIDLAVLENRISFSYDYFSKYTSDQLYSVPVPQASGYNSITTNIGDFKFWGHEFSINSKNLTSALKWTTDFNITFLNNEVVKLGTTNAPIGKEVGNPSITQVGQPIGMFYGYVFDGVYRNQAEFASAPKHATSEVGSVRYRDVSGPNGVPDGVIDNYDRTIIGNPNPKFIWGMTNTLNYKNFDFTVVVSGSHGNQIMNRTFEYTQNLDAVFNVTKDVAHRWRSEDNPVTEFTQVQNQAQQK